MIRFVECKGCHVTAQQNEDEPRHKMDPPFKLLMNCRTENNATYMCVDCGGGAFKSILIEDGEN